MKKIILLFILTFGLPVLAVNDLAPQWGEFCPRKYEDAEYMSARNFQRTFNERLAHPVAYRVFKYSIIGLPIAISAYNQQYAEQLRANYWVDRRDKFNNEINLCDQNSNKDNVINCYMNVRQLELTKNHEYNQQIIALENQRLQKMQISQQAYSNYNLNRMNNNLNNINGNLNGIRYGY